MKNLEREFRDVGMRLGKAGPGRCFVGEEGEKQRKEDLRPDLQAASRRQRSASNVSTFLDTHIPAPDGPLACLCINVHVFLNAEGGGLEYISPDDWVTRIPVNENS